MNRKSVIREMFSGERGRYEQVPLSEEYKEAEKQMFAVTDTFLEQLTKEQKELFDKAYDYMIDRGAEYATDHFVEGFKFGLLLGIECVEK